MLMWGTTHDCSPSNHTRSLVWRPTRAIIDLLLAAGFYTHMSLAITPLKLALANLAELLAITPDKPTSDLNGESPL